LFGIQLVTSQPVNSVAGTWSNVGSFCLNPNDPNYVHSMAAHPNGKVYLAGLFSSSIGGVSAQYLVEVDSSGSNAVIKEKNKKKNLNKA